MNKTWHLNSNFRCLGDLRKSTGPLVYTIFSSFIIATFVANLICYFGVWTVIMATAKEIDVSYFKGTMRIFIFTLLHHFKEN